ncbi:MAG: glutathione S-transferase family protein [Myxococcales bacterium]|nr:glutathione S-transferase family protein [Myxococcales bacterium]
MATVKLFGTLTSPYVRRVRIVAQELGLEVERIDTVSDEGQAALREVTPIWKVPTAVVGDQPLFDSAVITQHLLRHHGPGPLRPWNDDDVTTRNLVTVIDGALDALINVFYLAKDDVTGERASYVAKQSARAANAMTWVAARLPEAWTDADTPLGLGAIALYTTADWMRFRHTYDLARHPELQRFMAVHQARPSFVSTAPPEG